MSATTTTLCARFNHRYRLYIHKTAKQNRFFFFFFLLFLVSLILFFSLFAILNCFILCCITSSFFFFFLSFVHSFKLFHFVFVFTIFSIPIKKNSEIQNHTKSHSNTPKTKQCIHADSKKSKKKIVCNETLNSNKQ